MYSGISVRYLFKSIPPINLSNVKTGSSRSKQFEKAYIDLQEKRGKEADLGAIWQIEPISVREETFAVRQNYQRENLPLLRHVDALLVDDGKE